MLYTPGTFWSAEKRFERRPGVEDFERHVVDTVFLLFLIGRPIFTIEIKYYACGVCVPERVCEAEPADKGVWVAAKAPANFLGIQSGT